LVVWRGYAGGIKARCDFPQSDRAINTADAER
jgi:hypothetical protein